MGYHAVQLPTKFSAGSLFGPGFKTKIIETDSMAESRIQRAPAYGRRRYELSRGIAGLDDLRELVEFYTARGGAENSFRVKDWLDYSTTPTWTTHRDGDDAVTGVDVLLGTGDGSTTTFQLVKRYTSGPTEVVRPISKPILSSLMVTLDDSDVSGIYTCNDETGLLTFTTAPGLGVEVKAGFEFDTVGRFAAETDEALQIAIQAVEAGELPSISVVEDLSPVTVSQSRDFGGAKDHGNISANFTLSELHGTWQRFSPTTSGLKLFLPSPTYLATGGPFFAIKNDSATNSIALRNSGDTATVYNIAAQATAIVFLGYLGTTKTWWAA